MCNLCRNPKRNVKFLKKIIRENEKVFRKVEK